MMRPKELADRIAKQLDEKKASDVAIMEHFTESVICRLLRPGVRWKRQTDGCAVEVVERYAGTGRDISETEGKKTSGWILMDYSNVVVNVMTAEMREKYNIERIWGDCDTEYIN